MATKSALTKDQVSQLAKMKKVFLENIKTTYSNLGKVESRIKKFIYDADLKNKFLNRVGQARTDFLTLKDDINTFASVNQLKADGSAAKVEKDQYIIMTYDQAVLIMKSFNSRLSAIDDVLTDVNTKADDFLSGKMTAQELTATTSKNVKASTSGKAAAPDMKNAKSIFDKILGTGSETYLGIVAIAAAAGLVYLLIKTKDLKK